MKPSPPKSARVLELPSKIIVDHMLVTPLVVRVHTFGPEVVLRC